MPGVDLHSYMVALRDFVVNWWPLLGLTFYCVLLYIFWRMLQLMPRVKPATVIVDPRTAIDWADIAGADEAKAELAEIVEFLRDPKRFEELGAVVPKGVLLYGPPGTGKTLLARAAANESGAKFYAQSASAFVELFARQTSGLTGADLANIANEAAILAGRRSAKYVTALDFDNALERVVAGLQQKKVLTDKERRILAYHEAGHALMSHLMGELGHLQKVTIVSRGTSLGYTLHLPNEDRYLESKEELIDMLKIALAGRAAEQVVFGRVTNGAASDLEKVTEIARAMVFEWGMSDVVSSRTLRADNYGLSEETKRMRDIEQARLTDEAYAEAVRLIEKHRAPLDRLTVALLEKETINREEVLH